jgi:hypothetical protein
MACRAVGGKKPRHDVCGPLPGGGWMQGAVSEAQPMAGGGKRLGNAVEPEWAEGGMKPRQCETAAGAGGWRDGSLEITSVDWGRAGGAGWHAAGGATPPDTWPQAYAAVLVGQPCDWGAGGRGALCGWSPVESVVWHGGRAAGLFLRATGGGVWAGRAVSPALRPSPRHTTRAPEAARPTRGAAGRRPHSHGGLGGVLAGWPRRWA